MLYSVLKRAFFFFFTKCSLPTCFHSCSSCDGCGGGIEEMIESRNGTCRSLIEYDILGEDGYGRGVRQEGACREPRDEEEDEEDEEEEELSLSCLLSPHRLFLVGGKTRRLVSWATDLHRCLATSAGQRTLGSVFSGSCCGCDCCWDESCQ